MTKQEMFDRAYRGLHSQGWSQCLDQRGECVYTDGSRHCAWGWVDDSLPPDASGCVGNLHDECIGIAATLDDGEIAFALELQDAHDRSLRGAFESIASMRDRFDSLARQHGLTIPEVV